MSTTTQTSGDEPVGSERRVQRPFDVCPACGARAKAEASRCWFCEGDLSPPDPLLLGRHASLAGAVALPRSDEPLQFTLSTLLVVMTFIAACLGISVAVPPLGVPISAIALGGLVRTLAVARFYRRLGMPFGLDDKLAEFTVSCGIVIGAIGVLLITLLMTGFFGLLSAGALARFNIPTPVFVLLTWSYGIFVVVAPLFASGWFLWATRPR
jgi:hypothetical protein